MKHPYSKSAWAALLLLLVFATASPAQTTTIVRNPDGSIDADVAIEAFKAHIDTLDLTDLTSANDQKVINEFIFGLFPDNSEIMFKSKGFEGEYNDHVRVKLMDSCATVMRQMLENKRVVEAPEPDEPVEPEVQPIPWQWMAIGIAIFLIVLLVVVVMARQRKKRRRKSGPAAVATVGPDLADANADIVVRRKTMSVMRKCDLSDVTDNGNYLRIEGSDFCDDTAIRYMYIKNTCIQEIYNMYADDLRNPEKPNEDGCMVLGRWTHDKASDTYDVSLEEVLYPGDDADFSEYNLSFGIKIKMRMKERLRKLRTETNLQYDFTCWVHSHPGLGVFFSNTDSSLHILNKYPNYPRILTAIVIDILTPEQTLGIFTYKREGDCDVESTINSREDLKKMYSLEEWHKWAVDSSRMSYKPQDQFNTLEQAKSHTNPCYGIALTNGAIIDMDMLTTSHDLEQVKLVHGFFNNQSEKVTAVAVTVSDNKNVADNDLVGCFVSLTYRSIPSVKQAIAPYLGKIRFVLVYSTSDGLLTSIPIVSNDLCTEDYYGEQKLEELKIWTRRKR